MIGICVPIVLIEKNDVDIGHEMIGWDSLIDWKVENSVGLEKEMTISIGKKGWEMNWLDEHVHGIVKWHGHISIPGRSFRWELMGSDQWS